MLEVDFIILGNSILGSPVEAGGMAPSKGSRGYESDGTDELDDMEELALNMTVRNSLLNAVYSQCELCSNRTYSLSLCSDQPLFCKATCGCGSPGVCSPTILMSKLPLGAAPISTLHDA